MPPGARLFFRGLVVVGTTAAVFTVVNRGVGDTGRTVRMETKHKFVHSFHLHNKFYLFIFTSLNLHAISSIVQFTSYKIQIIRLQNYTEFDQF